jgi:dTDP-4-amino-4,6-dideoxygalactose transaminase
LSLHGISRDAWKRYAKDGPLHWETLAPGYKYNMSDIQAALGLRQLERVEEWWAIRRRHVQLYREGLGELPELILPGEAPGIKHAYHLLIVMLRTERLTADRDAVIVALKAENIGIGVHFRALHLHPYYREAFGLMPGSYPVAEWASERLFSLPLYPRMTPDDVKDVIKAVKKVLGRYAR